MKKALIVDDSMVMRMMLKRILRKIGYEVIAEADNGLKGVEKYQELNPDLVTMDITMPVMDGITALQEIMKINRSANVVMVSAMGQHWFVDEALSYGAKGFLIKPFREENVRNVLSGI
ncbi:MAG TPA: response regulator [Firmicutes bacterium]|uniref:Response regulator n=1 Tax=Capillibacterium thermochitinicola TaxID=2699427 RepID=A0A8J6I180_9FIRM|nr:response regulator [Capillibacterium thermochitinicola]MBA2133571.1 response regulator [Capillibacterium thermochitinicola]HHW11966.1 response regulator [Bacillota bacterium]